MEKTELFDLKDKIQRKGLNKWWKAPFNGRGTLQYATGVGKTRCGILAASLMAKRLNMDCNILILTPTEVIRDKSWKEEFYKWNEGDVYEQCVKCVCIQTAYKWIGHFFDLVIADELHNYLSPEYFNFFSSNRYNKLLGLSAYIDSMKFDLLNTIAPICDKVGTKKASELGLISPYKIYNIALSLSKEEQQDYQRANNNFNRLFPFFNKDLKLMYACMNTPKYINFLKQKGLDLDKEISSYPFQCNSAIMKRKKILYNAEAKLGAVKKLSDMFPEKKTIIFSQTIDFANKVSEQIGKTCVSFHSKISKKKRTENLDNFIDVKSKVTRISSAKALNEGMNIPDVSMAIIASGTSKAKDLIQRIGRAVRWEKGKQALIFHLYIEDSQEEKWVSSSQEGHLVQIFNLDKEYEIVK